MSQSPQGARAAPLFVTQQRQVREFLADQDRLATIKADWLYRLVGPAAKARILREHGFTPVAELPSRRRQALGGGRPAQTLSTSASHSTPF